jgi:arylsulfatase A-like enzyme
MRETMKRLTKKKIFLIAALLLVIIGALYGVYWTTLFFPDDIPLSIEEAKKSAPDGPSRVLDLSLIDQIDQAVLSGDFSGRLISSRINDLIKNGYLVKADSFVRSSRHNLVFRAGTGFPGVWVDERSSIVLPPKNSVSFSLRAKKGSRLEFSALSLGGAGSLAVDISSGGKNVQTRYGLSSYICTLKEKDVQLKEINRGFPRAKDDIGWREYAVDLASYEGRDISVSFTYNGDSGTAFIGNPKIFAESEKRRYNVIYLIFDGVPTRAWSFYNDKSDLTPFMKETAKRDFTVFDNLFTLGDKTRISTSGLFCSVYPFLTRHGINRNFIPESEINLFYDAVRNGSLATLPDTFRRNGYTSAQFGNSGFTVQLLSTGVDYGFERSYEFSFNPYGAYGISHRFFDFLRENKKREFFAYLHYNTPHKPFYTPLSHYAKALVNSPLESLWRPDFMACVSYSDEVFRSIYAALKEQGLLENTIIVVATDHGATFDLSKFGKGFQYTDFTRMTFMMHLPPDLKQKLNVTQPRVLTYLSSINTAPTLCDLAGITPPKAFMGKSYVPVLTGAFSGTMFDKEIWSFGRKEFSTIDRNLKKYILSYDEQVRTLDRRYIIFGEGVEVPSERIFDLARDPHEMNDLTIFRPDLLAKFRKRVLEFDPHHPERNVISFFPDDDKGHHVEIRVTSASPINSTGLYTTGLKEIPGLVTSGSAVGKTCSFDVKGEAVHFILECRNDRSPLSFFITVDGVPMKRENIFSTNLNLNVMGNPVEIKDRSDFIALIETSLPDAREFSAFKRKGMSAKVFRLDLHRWIDLGNLEMSGISSGMKETLRSWGYIQ